MTRVLALAPLALAVALPAFAQQQQHQHTPPPSQQQQAQEKPAHDHSTDEAPQRPETGAATDAATGADLEVGNEPPPPVPADNAADSVYGTEAMARARGILDSEHGGAFNSMIFARILEYQTSDGEDGFRWDAEAWYGGDINRLVLKTEGDGDFDDGAEAAELQALYSRAIGPYTDFQIGVRQDFEPDSRTYLAVGLETLLPYWFDADGSLFLSDDGDLFARLEGEYALRLTQRLVLEPRAELDLAAQDDAAAGIGSGVMDGELGLRLRYEIRREFAPYVGVVYERKFGDTADYARAAGEDVETTSFVAGLRAWY